MNLSEEIAPGATGIEQLRALIASGRGPGIMHSLQFEFISIEPGVAVFEAEPGLHAYNPIGVIHGGYIATLLDSAAGCAVHSMLPAGARYASLDLTVKFLRTLTHDTARVTCEGSVIHMGARNALAEARLVDGDGRLCAYASSSYLIIRPGT